MGMVKLTPCRLDAAVRIGRYTLMCATHESSTYCTYRALAGAVFFREFDTTTNFKQGSASRQCRNASFDSGEMTLWVNRCVAFQPPGRSMAAVTPITDMRSPLCVSRDPRFST